MSNVLDGLFGGIRRILLGGVEKPFHPSLNLTAPGATVTEGVDGDGNPTIELNLTALAGGFSVSGTPLAGYVPKYNGTSWVAAPIAGYDITSFSTTTLVECGQTITPSFTAAHNITPTSLVLTNNANAESRNVVGTPTAFATLLSVVRNVPNQTYTYTLTGGDGIGTDIASVAITWGQRNFAGVVTAGASLATLVTAATYTTLDTNGTFSFSLTSAGGAERGQFAFPTRYGAITSIKDNATGLGVGVTLLGAFSRTNAQGYAENYDQYELVSAFSGTKLFDVVD